MDRCPTLTSTAPQVLIVGVSKLNKSWVPHALPWGRSQPSAGQRGAGEGGTADDRLKERLIAPSWDATSMDLCGKQKPLGVPSLVSLRS